MNKEIFNSMLLLVDTREYTIVTNIPSEGFMDKTSDASLRLSSTEIRDLIRRDDYLVIRDINDRKYIMPYSSVTAIITD